VSEKTGPITTIRVYRQQSVSDERYHLSLKTGLLNGVTGRYIYILCFVRANKFFVNSYFFY